MKKLTITVLIMASVWSRISFTEAWQSFISQEPRPIVFIQGQHPDSQGSQGVERGGEKGHVSGAYDGSNLSSDRSDGDSGAIDRDLH